MAKLPEPVPLVARLNRLAGPEKLVEPLLVVDSAQDAAFTAGAILMAPEPVEIDAANAEIMKFTPEFVTAKPPPAVVV